MLRLNRFASNLPTTAKKGKARRLAEFFKSKEYISGFPKEYLRSNLSAGPNAVYIAHDETAEKISSIIAKYIKPVPFIEVNPGVGLLTKRLLQICTDKIILCEHDKSIHENLTKSLVNHVAEGSVSIVHSLKACKDVVKCRKWEEGVGAQLFCCLSSASLIASITRDIHLRTQLLERGRVEFFFTLPAHEAIKLTSGPEADYRSYITSSCVFQILFEYELLERLDRRCFLPWWDSRSPEAKHNQRHGDMPIEDEPLYLMRLVPRKDLFSFCKKDDLPALLYFILQLFSKRHAFIFQKLEQWIPGSVASFICNHRKAEPAVWLKDTDMDRLPPLSRPCCKVTANDFYPKLSSFTKCGELTPMQLFSLFNLFMNLPEYEASGFAAAASKFLTEQKAETQ